MPHSCEMTCLIELYCLTINGNYDDVCVSQANHRETVHTKLRQMFDDIVSTMDNTYKTFREDGREVCTLVIFRLARYTTN